MKKSFMDSQQGQVNSTTYENRIPMKFNPAHSKTILWIIRVELRATIELILSLIGLRLNNDEYMAQL